MGWAGTALSMLTGAVQAELPQRSGSELPLRAPQALAEQLAAPQHLAGNPLLTSSSSRWPMYCCKGQVEGRG